MDQAASAAGSWAGPGPGPDRLGLKCYWLGGWGGGVGGGVGRGVGGGHEVGFPLN